MSSDESLLEQRPARKELPPGHRCGVDDLEYQSVGFWYSDHRGYFPTAAAMALQRFMSVHGCTFAEAFTAMVNSGAIILAPYSD